MDFQEVRPWAKSISEVVANGTMPPWHAAKEFRGKFKNERHLSDEERKTILDWVQAGAPMGNPADAPAPLPRQFLPIADSTPCYNIGATSNRP
jgi:hypothetical protein